MLSVPLVPQHSCRLDLISMTECSYFGDTSFGYPAAVGDGLVQPWITSESAPQPDLPNNVMDQSVAIQMFPTDSGSARWALLRVPKAVVATEVHVA
jgi:hypothetical protein